MPDLEQRIREGLDSLGQAPDPARIVERVGRRKSHFRVMHRVQTVTLVVAVLAGVAGGTYGLSRAFGVGDHGPVPGHAPVHPTPSLSTTPPSPGGSSTPAMALCSDQAAVVTAASAQGAAGTISTLWEVTNTAQRPCRSLGYPRMDFHTASGWLNVQVGRGGYPDINNLPTSIVAPSGQSLYFVSYWGDVGTSGGACQQFDLVRVTLPDNRVPAEVASTGCLDPHSVRVGPVTSKPPR